MAYPKETVEAGKGVLALAAEIVKLAKDGVQISDAVVLAEKLKQEPLKTLVAEAIKDADKIDEELKDVGTVDALKAAADLAPAVIEFIGSFKKA